VKTERRKDGAVNQRSPPLAVFGGVGQRTKTRGHGGCTESHGSSTSWKPSTTFAEQTVRYVHEAEAPCVFAPSGLLHSPTEVLHLNCMP